VFLVWFFVALIHDERKIRLLARYGSHRRPLSGRTYPHRVIPENEKKKPQEKYQKGNKKQGGRQAIAP